jgi:hypothetical protein
MVQLFLSIVTDEFRIYREELRKMLKRPNVDVHVQEDFIPTGTETLDKLDTYIRHCDVVVHLIGHMTGSWARPSTLQTLRERHRDLATRLPLLKPSLETDDPPLSYTQWEAYLAIYHHKMLIIALPEPNAPRDVAHRIESEQVASQQAHIARLHTMGRYPEIKFNSVDQLAAKLLLSSILELLPQTPKPIAPRDPLIHIFHGHTARIGGVTSVAIAPDGRTALSGSNDNTLKLWDLARRCELATLQGHTKAVATVAIAPDCRTALSGAWDTKVRMWDLSSRREIHTFSGHPGWFLACVNSVAITPDGHTALSAGADMTLKFWDLLKREQIRILRGHTKAVNSVAISPDGHTALSGGSDGMIKLWELASGREIYSWTGHKGIGGVSSLAIAPEGDVALSAGGDNMLKLWNISIGQKIREWEGHTGPRGINSVAMTPHGRTALSGGGDGMLKLWDLSTGQEMRAPLTAHVGFSGVNSVAVAPDGRTALSAGADNTLKLWELT